MHACMPGNVQCDSTCKQGPWCTDAVRGGVQQTCSSKVTQDCEGASSRPSHLLPLRSQILHCRSCGRVQMVLLCKACVVEIL